jgi:hypothetical protein
MLAVALAAIRGYEPGLMRSIKLSRLEADLGSPH